MGPSHTHLPLTQPILQAQHPQQAQQASEQPAGAPGPQLAPFQGTPHDRPHSLAGVLLNRAQRAQRLPRDSPDFEVRADNDHA